MQTEIAFAPKWRRPIRFDGADIIHKLDTQRLTGQMQAIFELMKDGRWRTLQEISALGYGEASISAQLRNMRKPRFGGHTVNRRRRNEQGLFEYQLIWMIS